MLSLDNTYDHDDLKEWFDDSAVSRVQAPKGIRFPLEVQDVSMCRWLLSPRLMVWRSVCDGNRATWCWL